MKAAVVTVFVCALAGATSGPAEAKSRWTLAQARAVLGSKHFAVPAWSQPDLPDYELVFRRSAAKSLRAVGRRLVFDGLAHDEVTDGDVRVRFTFGRPGRLTGLRGPAADTSQPLFPIRAAFYYAWYPEAWSRNAVYPYSRFQPSLDYYSADDADIVRRHLAALRYAHLGAAIYSWWGPLGYPLTDTRFWRYLAAARTTPFRWAVYYEREGYEDPSVEKIRSDLEYIRDLYATKPAYLRIDGRFVVFVYGGAGDSCESTSQAWHEYSATLPTYSLPPDAFIISPGFDEAGSAGPRLSRDLTRWREDVAAMVVSGAPWQLVLSFNEWPEGTSVESAREWETPSGFGAYLDALHEALP